jgi:hypothetical protein
MAGKVKTQPIKPVARQAAIEKTGFITPDLSMI